MKIADFITKLRLLDSTISVSIYDNSKDTDDSLFTYELHSDRHNPYARNDISVLLNTYIDSIKSVVGELSFDYFTIDDACGDIYIAFYLRSDINYDIDRFIDHFMTDTEK